MIGTRSACKPSAIALRLKIRSQFYERGLTAPLWISIARTAVHDFKNNGRRVKGISNKVVRSIGICSNKFNAFSARQIIVKCTREVSPELLVLDFDIVKDSRLLTCV
jgi:hypothetical protein